MTKLDASTRMKAMVAARLLMGEFNSWTTFDKERGAASKILNRQTARSVSAQIGRTYRDLSTETQKFILQNFEHCDFEELATLCDAIPAGAGIYERFDEFERKFFPLAKNISKRFPFHAHVSIGLWGLQFEFPEYHFVRDLEVAISELQRTRDALSTFKASGADPKKSREIVASIVGSERFISRSIISAAFSLVEAFTSGLFYSATTLGSIGKMKCDEDFVQFARTKESAPLSARIDRLLRFVSNSGQTAANDPFKSLMGLGKRYRDAIHHTTPFERKGMDAGARLLALYEIDGGLALQVVILSCDSLIRLSEFAFGSAHATVIGESCSALRDKAATLNSSVCP